MSRHWIPQYIIQINALFARSRHSKELKNFIFSYSLVFLSCMFTLISVNYSPLRLTGQERLFRRYKGQGFPLLWIEILRKKLLSELVICSCVYLSKWMEIENRFFKWEGSACVECQEEGWGMNRKQMQSGDTEGILTGSRGFQKSSNAHVWRACFQELLRHVHSGCIF